MLLIIKTWPGGSLGNLLEKILNDSWADLHRLYPAENIP